MQTQFYEKNSQALHFDAALLPSVDKTKEIKS